MPVALPDALIELLRKPSPCFVATLMSDGSPQLTETWVTTDGGKEGIDELSRKYLGIPYPYFSGYPDETRLVVTIEADNVNTPMRG